MRVELYGCSGTACIIRIYLRNVFFSNISPVINTMILRNANENAAFLFAVDLCIIVVRLSSTLRAVGLFRSDILLFFNMVWP